MLKLIEEEKLSIDDNVDPINGLKLISIYKIMALFLSEVSANIRTEFYKEIVFFVVMYTKALNKVGWEIKAKLIERTSEDETKEFCSENNGEFIPEICNEFITDLLPEYLREYDISSFKVLGAEVSQIRNAVFLTQHFCNWLNYHTYTSSRLVLNPEDN